MRLTKIEIVRREVPVNVSPDDVITLSDAAKDLGLSFSALGVYTRDGTLTLYRVPESEEPNLRKSGRLLRSEVLAFKAARQKKSRVRAGL
jgi:hypothetical protein